MRLPWLPDVLRAAGLDVDVYPGWETRGGESWGPLRGVICHATASSHSSTDAGDMRVLWVTGSVTAPAPISQCFLSRTGRWVVGATGRCNHVLVGDKGPHKGFGNSALIGVEAQNDNRGEPWSAHMLDSYVRGVAAICAHQGWAAGMAVAHREHQTGKSDPLGIDMAQFRAGVQAALSGGDDMTPEEHQMLKDLHFLFFDLDSAPRPPMSVAGKIETIRAAVTAGVDLSAVEAAAERGAEKGAEEAIDGATIQVGEG